MTRQYIKLDPSFPERKEYYPDGAFRALVTVFCTASYQPEPGVFRSERLLKAILGKHARWVGLLVDERDLERMTDGSLQVVGWGEWQEGKYPTVDARMSAIKDRRRPLTPAERAFLHRQKKKAIERDVQSDDDRDASRDGSVDTSTLRNATSTSLGNTGATPLDQRARGLVAVTARDGG